MPCDGRIDKREVTQCRRIDKDPPSCTHRMDIEEKV